MVRPSRGWSPSTKSITQTQSSSSSRHRQSSPSSLPSLNDPVDARIYDLPLTVHFLNFFNARGECESLALELDRCRSLSLFESDEERDRALDASWSARTSSRRTLFWGDVGVVSVSRISRNLEDIICGDVGRGGE